METLTLKCNDEPCIEVEASDNGTVVLGEAPTLYLGMSNYEDMTWGGGYAQMSLALTYSDTEKLKDYLEAWLKENKDASAN